MSPSNIDLPMLKHRATVTNLTEYSVRQVRFVTRDYKSMTHGSTSKLSLQVKLSSCEETSSTTLPGATLKVIESLVPALPPGSFLSPKSPVYLKKA